MPRGLRFCAVDLHVHTPASKCFLGTVTPEEYVAQAIEAGMQAIAITDHNTGDWIDRIKEAASGTSLTVFPGVEISVQPGVHILAIFPETRGGAHVNDLLAKLHLGADDRGEQEALVTKFGAQEVVFMIRKEGALPILAHIDDYKGAWRELSGQTRIKLWQAAEFAAVEIVGERLPGDIGREPYAYKPAYYWASDNPHPENRTKHSHLGIGQRYSLFKMDEQISWEGLRLCFHDPEVRIRPYRDSGSPIQLTTGQHPAIQRLRIDGGFMNGVDLELNPNLNCIIGGRGTGKSTLLELIRYAFDVQPKTETNDKQAQSLIRSTFPPGSKITIDFSADGANYRLERQSSLPARVYREGVADPLDVAPALLLPLQAYGQKEIYEISQDPQFQLRLLDNYVADEIRPWREKETGFIRSLEENAEQILRKKAVMEESLAKLAAIGAVREELRRMEEQGFVSRLQDKSNYDKEKRLFGKAEDEITRLQTSLENLLSTQRLNVQFLTDLADLPNAAWLGNEKQRLVAVDNELAQTIAQLTDSIQAIWAAGEGERQKWQAAYAAQEEAYQQLLREFQNSSGRLTPNRYIELQKQLAQLAELEAESRNEAERLDSLYQDRQQLLAQLRRVRREQYEIRCQKAKQLTEALGRVVRITIHPEGNRAVYDQFLEQLFRGSGLRTDARQTVAFVEADEPEQVAERPVTIRGETRYIVPRIPCYLDPIHLAEAIRAEWENDDVLKTRWGISSDAMRRNLTRLNEEQLFALETFAVPDLPVIELRIGSGALTYRSLDELSVGQRCTALLGIVLLESSATLLVDQPEDDLDNQFIFAQIVNTLRREKERRQFIIATHNANIPVSGDAELIIVVEADEKRGWIAEDGAGSIDTAAIKAAVERILEGGAQAFQIRKEKYGI
jgi:PHP family Zn ribbon phosphoesterase